MIIPNIMSQYTPVMCSAQKSTDLQRRRHLVCVRISRLAKSPFKKIVHPSSECLIRQRALIGSSRNLSRSLFRKAFWDEVWLKDGLLKSEAWLIDGEVPAMIFLLIVPLESRSPPLCVYLRRVQRCVSNLFYPLLIKTLPNGFSGDLFLCYLNETLSLSLH